MSRQTEETVATFDPPAHFYRVMYEDSPNESTEYPIPTNEALDLDKASATAEWVAHNYRAKAWVVKVTTTDG